MLAICIPSRGLVHSRTIDNILQATGGYDTHFYFSHGRPIPDAQNYIIEEALQSEANYFWFVEDDMQLPVDILDKLFAARADIATADYPVRESQHVVTYLDGKFAYAGLGCTLIHRSVFERLERPYFSVDREYQIQDGKLIPKERTDSTYGIFDVDFYQRAMQTSTIKVINEPAGQYYLLKPELPKYNNQSALEYDIKWWTFT